MLRFDDTDSTVRVLRAHDLEIDRDRYIVSKGDEEFHLPKKEFELLYYLASKKGKVRNRQTRSEEHTSELQSRGHLVCRLLLEKKKTKKKANKIKKTQTSKKHNSIN